MEMSDYISREAALDAISEWLMKALHPENTSSYNEGERAAYRTAISEIAELPPHGRLIDADALKVSLVFAEKTAEWAVPALRAVLMVIDEMPTIIPAEEGE